MKIMIKSPKREKGTNTSTKKKKTKPIRVGTCSVKCYNLKFGFHRLAINGINQKSNQPLVHKTKAPDEPKELNRADKKRLQKLRKEMIKRGEDTYEIDLQLGLE